MIEAAVFDLDGTLVNLPVNYEELYAESKKIVGTDQIEPMTKTVAALNETLRQRVFALWTNIEHAALKKMTIIQEGMRLYQQYTDKPKALVTMQSKEIVGEILNALSLSFQAVITREDSLDRLTQIEKAIEKLRSRSENVIVIGDRETDQVAAEKLGCKFRMVKT